MSTGHDASLAALARAAGLEPEWTDAADQPRRVGDDALAVLLDALGLPAASLADREWSLAALAAPAAPPPLVTATAGEAVPWPAAAGRAGGGYTLTLEDGARVTGRLAADPAGGGARLPAIDTPGYHLVETDEASVTVAVAPARGWTIGDAAFAAGRQRPWGLAAQLYGLRRAGDFGIGDTTALAALAGSAARLGADALAISPTHATFPAQPERDSPYSPSSRRWHNLAYVDPDDVAGPQATAAALAETGLADTAARLAAAPLVDWPLAVHTKLRVLRALFERWRAHPSPDADAFARFVADGGAALHAHACFDALHAQALADRREPDWRRWPEALRGGPNAPGVRAFAAAHADDVAFFSFAQWLAARGLDGAHRAARGAGMSIGTIADLAVGCAPDGSDAWAAPGLMLGAASIGAPPDLFNADGQAWGVTTWTPAALRASGFAPFIALLRAAFAHAGGVRIDHILGFARLWIVRDGTSARDGAYLRYPLDDLLRLVALESSRHRAIAIGEDLGTVPDGLRERLAARGIAGMRVLWFERDADGAFRRPERWDRDAVAMPSTHDLPTLAGWWRGVDLAWRRHVAAPDAGREGGDKVADATSKAAVAPATDAATPPAAPGRHDAFDAFDAFAASRSPADPPVTWPPSSDPAPSVAASAEPRAAAPLARDAEAATPAGGTDQPAASPPSTHPVSRDMNPTLPAHLPTAAPPSLPPDLAERDADRAALWSALVDARVVPAPASSTPPAPDAPPVAAALAFVARSASALALVPLEDLLALPAQPNLPGPPVGHPNWRRRMPRETAGLLDDAADATLAAVALARRTGTEAP
ncbi:4-alpha-glucanotransferase [Burkholderia plantarii]|uniref:4-alpha-glucanotransferase n=1 Tax=Burkholderia plantarii TaxID=41899 RepID=UPI00272B1263|nr:4-alpha-glucanotransferase [Burkholderia plantarii]WLE62222.1 4-alpha-glucanotransferase [Burkholderia plantarii]